MTAGFRYLLREAVPFELPEGRVASGTVLESSSYVAEMMEEEHLEKREKKQTLSKILNLLLTRRAQIYP